MLATLEKSIHDLITECGGQWGIYLEDLQSNEVWGLHQDERFYAASLIKVPIMAAVFAESYAGKFALEDKITLRKEDQVGGAGILQHMTPGTSWSIYDLVTLMIIQSDNTATNLLIDLVGTEAIQSAISKTGMKNSQFYNKLMIIPAELEGYNEITAADLGNHLRSLATGKFISYNSCLQMIQILKQQQHRDRIPYLLPDPDGEWIGMLPKWELANKTGTVTGTAHDIGIFYVGDRAITICLLSRDVDIVKANQVMAKIGRMVYELYAL
ncbi:class A beta-lactamase-related serine hydrolase [Brevibacillus ruminantium]|uniref:Class A beta-lactamase-related serine hydrolase n=1 Tax=Brevibacillus ruminantium TaxID=2950604 RepID=A0ABY4WGZ5_9BACL|nr:serine hydrolase [Brevibacillus ruminantium]USG63926.1 class A beta-lactamase-related serine hydrolase [Brevibacillus ruminantium]